MLSHERVIVANDAAGLRYVFIIIELFKGEICELSLILFYVEYVGVSIHILETEGIDL